MQILPFPCSLLQEEVLSGVMSALIEPLFEGWTGPTYLVT